MKEQRLRKINEYFNAAWKLLKKYASIDHTVNNDKYWSDFKKEYEALSSIHNDECMDNLILVVIKEIERTKRRGG